MSDIAPNKKRNDWVSIVCQIFSMTFDPWRHFPFVMFALLGVVVFGGLGIWAEVIKYSLEKGEPSLSGLLTAVLTFFPALVGSASLQLLASATGKADKNMTMLAAFLLVGFVVTAILLAVYSTTYPILVLKLSVVCSIGAFWTWWIANGDDPTFKNSDIPNAATGGDTNRSLSGTLDGFKK